MFNQYFGSYLLNKGILTPQQLKAALDYTESTHVKLGVLAMNACLMNASQVAEVQNLQKTMDKKFGELAVMRGYVSEDQVQGLLQAQKTSHVVLSQTLIDHNYLSLEQLEEALRGYKEDSGLTAEQLEAIQQGDIDNVVRAFLGHSEDVYGVVVQEFVSLLLKNIIRFLGDTPRIEAKVKISGTSFPLFVHQPIEGTIGLFPGIAMDESVFMAIARAYSGMYIETETELAEASVTEFLNLNNGLFIVNMDDHDIDLTLQPPEVIRSFTVSSNDITAVPCYMGMGMMYILISKDKYF